MSIFRVIRTKKPILEYHYDAESGGVALFEGNYILPYDRFKALVIQAEKFYNHHGCKTIESHNSQVDIECHTQPAARPSRVFDTDKIPPSKPNRVSPRDCEPGYVYLMQSHDNSYVYKIGLTRNVERRKSQIGGVDIIHVIPVDNMAEAEALLHGIYQNQRLTGEWFKLYDPNIEYIISLSEYKDGQFIVNGNGSGEGAI